MDYQIITLLLLVFFYSLLCINYEKVKDHTRSLKEENEKLRLSIKKSNWLYYLQEKPNTISGLRINSKNCAYIILNINIRNRVLELEIINSLNKKIEENNNKITEIFKSFY